MSQFLLANRFRLFAVSSTILLLSTLSFSAKAQESSTQRDAILQYRANILINTDPICSQGNFSVIVQNQIATLQGSTDSRQRVERAMNLLKDKLMVRKVINETRIVVRGDDTALRVKEMVDLLKNSNQSLPEMQQELEGLAEKPGEKWTELANSRVVAKQLPEYRILGTLRNAEEKNWLPIPLLEAQTDLPDAVVLQSSIPQKSKVIPQAIPTSYQTHVTLKPANSEPETIQNYLNRACQMDSRYRNIKWVLEGGELKFSGSVRKYSDIWDLTANLEGSTLIKRVLLGDVQEIP